MKTKFLSILIIVVLMLNICVLVSCDEPPDKNGTHDTSMDTDENVFNPSDGGSLALSVDKLANTEIKYTPSPYEVKESYIKDGYYYYCIKLGTVSNVPVDDSVHTHLYNMSAFGSEEYTTSKVTTTSVTHKKEFIIERLEYDRDVASITWDLGVDIFELFGVNLGGNVSYYSDSTTTTDKIETSVTNEQVISKTKTINLSFDSTCQYGYYRYRQTMKYDIFAVICKDAENGEVKACELVPLAIKNSLMSEWQYSDTEFPIDNDMPNIENFEFDILNISSQLPIPTKDISVFAGGNGSESKPYKIANIQQFLSIQEYRDKHFVLLNDIPLGILEKPLGNHYWDHTQTGDDPAEPFTGTLDGGNYTITYSMDVSGLIKGKDFAYGLFAASKNATFKNIKLQVDIDTPSGDNNCRELCMGGLVGLAQDTEFINCTVLEGSRIYNNDTDECYYVFLSGMCDIGATYSGGLVGDARQCKFNSCINYATVEAHGYSAYAGGIAGSGYDCTSIGSDNKIPANATHLSWVWGENASGDLYGKTTAPEYRLDGKTLLTKP